MTRKRTIVKEGKPGPSLISEMFVFAREAVLEFNSTGTFFPTSRWAAERLIAPVTERKNGSKLRILEIGPGTGSVTVHILKHLQPGDELTIVEINERFLDSLKKRLQTNSDYLRNKDAVHFYNCAIQDLPVQEKFDVIVCAIPFLNLDVATVRSIFDKLRILSADHAVMTYYEYLGLRSIGMAVSPPRRKNRLRQLDGFFREIFDQHLVRRDKVYYNVLPINVYRLEGINGESSIPSSYHQHAGSQRRLEVLDR